MAKDWKDRLTYRLTITPGGKMFDPRDQERTTPNEDFNKAHEEEDKKMLDKMFKPVKEDDNGREAEVRDEPRERGEGRSDPEGDG